MYHPIWWGLIKWDDTNVHILSHTLHYGTGVFEGVRAYNTDNGGAIFRLQDHTARLFDAASKLNIQIPLTEDDLNKAQIDVLKANNLNEAYIRPIVYLGNESLDFHFLNKLLVLYTLHLNY